MLTSSPQNLPLEELKREVMRLLSYTKGKLKSLKKAEEKLAQADKYRLWAETLQANLRFVPRGKEKVRLYHPVEGEVEVPLDVRLDGVRNMERYYKEWKRLRRGAKKVAAQLEHTEEEVKRIEEWLRWIESGKWVEEAADAVRRFLAKPQDKRRERKRKLRCFISSDGFRIYVGRNAKENDWLTLFFAAPNDLFLHTSGYAGSHVIIRTKGRDIPERTIYEAALLAVYYSKARGKDAEVGVARIADVRKPRRAKEGLVYVRKWRTVRVGVDHKTLNKLLAQLEETKE